MRECRKNQQKLYYALLIGSAEEYKLDKDGNKIVDYIDDDGTVYYRTTGKEVPIYSEPVPFKASISFGGNDTEATPFGISIADYDATLIKANLPITETSLIWYESEIEYEDEEKTRIKRNSADYTVAKITPSLNTKRYELKAIVK